MSLVLYAEPVQPRKPHWLGGHPLKGLLCRAFGESDGSLREEFVFTAAHVPALQVIDRLHGIGTRRSGIDHGGSEDVTDGIAWLIEAIREHGAVRVWTDE